MFEYWIFTFLVLSVFAGINIIMFDLYHIAAYILGGVSWHIISRRYYLSVAVDWLADHNYMLRRKNKNGKIFYFQFDEKDNNADNS